MPIQNSLTSPLRYPGSKAKLVNYIDDLLSENGLEGCTFIEPYAGSSVVSIYLLQKEKINNAIIIERDPLLYTFWESVFSHTEELIEKLSNLPITLETWHRFQIYRKVDDVLEYPIVDMGLAGLFFNRTNFSGILKANPLGGLKQNSEYKIDCRFNKQRILTLIQQISQLKSSIQVIYSDALEYMKNNISMKKNNCFLYVDPPYYQKGKSLYRYWYTHNNHKELSAFLMKCKKPWLVSYDNHSEIRKLYKKAKGMQNLYFDYSVSKYRKEQELLISNLQIPPFYQEIFNNILADF